MSTHNTREGKSFDELLEGVNPGDTVTGFLKADLKTTHHQELQKARELTIEKINDFINGMKAEINISNEYKLGYRQALLDLKEALQSELDQPTV